MDGYLTINIDILQRTYTLKIREQDESIVRQASQRIEDSVQRYASKGVIYRDKQDLLAMTLLESTVSILRNKRESEDLKLSNALIDRLKSIDELLTSEIEGKD